MVRKDKKNKGGRKLFDGKDPKEVLPKLEQAALIDASVEEMCFYADISPRAYYRYIEKNPRFRQKIQALRERLTLKSRQNIAGRIEAGDVSLSKWQLERKKPDEYAERLKLDHSGEITTDNVLEEDRKAVKELLRERIHQRIKESKKVKA